MSLMDIFDADFETGVHADARSFITCVNQTSITVETSAKRSGTYGVKWNPSPAGTPPNVSLEVLPKVNGQSTVYIPSSRGTHTFSIWLRTNLVQGEHNLVLRLRAYDTNGTLLSEESYWPSSTVPVTTTWQQFTVSQEPVTKTAYIQPVVEVDLVEDLNNASFYIDDLSLDFVSEPVEVDGAGRPNFVKSLRLEVQKARNDAFVWGISTWTGYRWGGATDTAESGVEWLNVLGTSHDIKVNRGAKRDGLTVALEAGSLTATILDPAVDPNTNPYIKPGTPIRLVYNAGLGDVSVFTGAIRQVQVTYKGAQPQVFISAIDKVKDLGNINRSGVVSGTFEERVFELVEKHGIPVWGVFGGSSLVLAQNAYDSSLLNHLQLAANTEQGVFFVNRDNQIVAYGKNFFDFEGAPVLWFSDKAVEGTDVTYFTDIAVAYDSASMANDIYVNNKTYGLSEEMEPISVETKYGPYRNVTSIATYGAYSEEIDTNFSDELDVADFATQVLDSNDAPELRVDRIRWNATKTQNKAASLEVFDTVNVEYTNEAFHIGENFNVLALEHTITANPTEHRWMVDVDLISMNGGS